jgi:two-component system chemotaxis response regulator CheY
MKILIVDDSRVMRRIIGGAAKVLEYDISQAGNGVEALEVLETEFASVDAITMDVAMPEMNGLECLEAIKADERFAKIPVIMVSAEGDKDTLLKAIRLGAVHYINKPFTSEDITSRLMEVLGVEDEF